MKALLYFLVIHLSIYDLKVDGISIYLLFFENKAFLLHNIFADCYTSYLVFPYFAVLLLKKMYIHRVTYLVFHYSV